LLSFVNVLATGKLTNGVTMPIQALRVQALETKATRACYSHEITGA